MTPLIKGLIAGGNFTLGNFHLRFCRRKSPESKVWIWTFCFCFNVSEEPSCKAVFSEGQSVFGKQTGAVLNNLLTGWCRDINGVLSATICCKAVSSADDASFFFFPPLSWGLDCDRRRWDNAAWHLKGVMENTFDEKARCRRRSEKARWSRRNENETDPGSDKTPEPCSPNMILGNICFIIGLISIYRLYPPSVWNDGPVLRSHGGGGEWAERESEVVAQGEREEKRGTGEESIIIN